MDRRIPQPLRKVKKSTGKEKKGITNGPESRNRRITLKPCMNLMERAG